jgi:NADPH2 dehydrogenase
VHKNKSFIYLQLWALGRAAYPQQLSKESQLTGQPLPYTAPSPIRLSTSNPSDPAPRALTLAEISEYVEFYAQAAENAVYKAGFDGVEVHGANGYLIDQFLQDVSNTRTDEYGGSVENRARFGLEVLDAVVKRVGAKKVGLRMSPWSPFQGEFHK